MLPVNRVYAPIYYPPTQAQQDSPPSTCATLCAASSPLESVKKQLLSHLTFRFPAMASNTIGQALDDLNLLPLHNVNRPCWPPVALHPRSCHRVIRSHLRHAESTHRALSIGTSPQQRTYARAQALGALYTEAIVQYGAAQASSSEYCYLFLERVATLSPSLARHCSKLVFSQPDAHGVQRTKHAAVLFDALAPTSGETALPPNQTITLTLNDFLRNVHFNSPRFAIIDPSGVKPIFVFDSANSFDQSSVQVFDMLHGTGADVCNADLRVSFALALSTLPPEYAHYAHRSHVQGSQADSRHADSLQAYRSQMNRSHVPGSHVPRSHALEEVVVQTPEPTPVLPHNRPRFAPVPSIVPARRMSALDVAFWSSPHRHV